MSAASFFGTAFFLMPLFYHILTIFHRPHLISVSLKKYRAIKQAIDQRQREYSTPKKSTGIICPAVVELESDTRNSFAEYVISSADEIIKDKGADFVLFALPRCGEDEQKITEYAKRKNDKALILPLTMFDINSFRRLQNVLLRMILSLDMGRCPSCGGEVRGNDNQYVCDNCYRLMITKTICPNPECKHTYRYLSYDVSADTILNMQCVDEDNFFQVDSLYQYKDIVPMSVVDGKLRAKCPCCGQ